MKEEEVALSDTILATGDGLAGDGRTAATSGWNGRKKRKAHAASSSTQTPAGSPASRKTHSNRRRGKRPREAVDDDVIVLEPEDQSFAARSAESVVDRKSGANVTIKPEPYSEAP